MCLGLKRIVDQSVSGIWDDVVDRHMRAVGGQPPRDRRADATAATGDQRPFTFESQLLRHEFLSQREPVFD
jgi:hypothetical protein